MYTNQTLQVPWFDGRTFLHWLSDHYIFHPKVVCDSLYNKLYLTLGSLLVPPLQRTDGSRQKVDDVDW